MSSQPALHIQGGCGDEGGKAEGDLEQLGPFLFGNQENMDTKHPFQVSSPTCFGSAGSCTSTSGYLGSQGYAKSWQQELGRKGEQQHQH